MVYSSKFILVYKGIVKLTRLKHWGENMTIKIGVYRKIIYFLLYLAIPFVLIAIAMADYSKAASTLPPLVNNQDEVLQECKDMIIEAPIPTAGISINDNQNIFKLRTHLRNIFTNTYAKVACNPAAANTITQEFLNQKNKEIHERQELKLTLWEKLSTESLELIKTRENLFTIDAELKTLESAKAVREKILEFVIERDKMFAERINNAAKIYIVVPLTIAISPRTSLREATSSVFSYYSKEIVNTMNVKQKINAQANTKFRVLMDDMVEIIGSGAVTPVESDSFSFIGFDRTSNAYKYLVFRMLKIEVFKNEGEGVVPGLLEGICIVPGGYLGEGCLANSLPAQDIQDLVSHTGDIPADELKTKLIDIYSPDITILDEVAKLILSARIKNSKAQEDLAIILQHWKVKLAETNRGNLERDIVELERKINLLRNDRRVEFSNMLEKKNQTEITAGILQVQEKESIIILKKTVELIAGANRDPTSAMREVVMASFDSMIDESRQLGPDSVALVNADLLIESPGKKVIGPLILANFYVMPAQWVPEGQSVIVRFTLIGIWSVQSSEGVDVSIQPMVKFDGQRDLEISQYEISLAWWHRCVEAGKCDNAKMAEMDITKGDIPVYGISWEQAVNFTEWYTEWFLEMTGNIGRFRLPTVAEWKIAAGLSVDGKVPEIPWMNNSGDACRYENVADETGRVGHLLTNFYPCDDGYASVAPSGQFVPNKIGAYDIIGNLKEWTSDCSEKMCAVVGLSWRNGPPSREKIFSWSELQDISSGSSLVGFRIVRDRREGSNTETAAATTQQVRLDNGLLEEGANAGMLTAEERLKNELNDALERAHSAEFTLEQRLEEFTALNELTVANERALVKQDQKITSLEQVLEEARVAHPVVEDHEREKARLDEEEVIQLAAALKSREDEASRLATIVEDHEREKARLDQAFSAARDRSSELMAKLSDESERTALAQRELSDRDVRLSELQDLYLLSENQQVQARDLTARQSDKIGVLNRQILVLRTQLARIEEALDTSENKSEEQNVVIADLGRRLNLALAAKIEELAEYRSEFFGRLRQALAGRKGFTIIGDRFVFQSEVLFSSGSAELGSSGKAGLNTFANVLKDVMMRIPEDLPWILQVDGHTDRIPIRTPRFPSNWELSAGRAIEVVNYLVTQGIPPERLSATGYGQFQPLDRNDDEIAHRRNRRIELKLTQR